VRFALLAPWLVLALPTVLVRAEEAAVSPPEAISVEGMPPVPRRIADRARRFTEFRSAAFQDWHPTERQILVTTRFGDTAQVHRVGAPGAARTQLTFGTEPVAAATFDPRGAAFIIFTRDTGGNEFTQLHRLDLADGETTLLTDGGRSQNGGLVWNRAGDRFAYASTRRNGADRDIRMMDPADPSSDRIVVECSGGGWSVEDWSPDDRQLLLREYLSINRAHLSIVDVASGARRRITADAGDVAHGRARFTDDGRGVITTSDRDGEFLRLCRIDVASGAVAPVVTDIPWDVEDFEPAPDGRTVAFVTNEAGASVLRLLDADTGRHRPVAGVPPGVIRLGPWRRGGGEFGISVESARSPADAWSVDAATGTLSRWTESETGGLVTARLPEAESVRWKSFDGREISGFRYRPPARFNGPRPVVIVIHGGPEGQSRPVFLGRSNFLLDELGLTLIYPNVRGSSGFGKTFLKLDNGLDRMASVRDISALLDWIATQPDLDASRVMVTGGSYGGFMTLAVSVAEADRIRCGLDIVGISHFGTFLRNTESYRRDLRRVEYGDEREPDVAAFFERIAPLNNADRISKPLFVVQGGNDPRVPRSEADQMVAKVRGTGTPLWYMVASDEGHGFRKKANADFQFWSTVLFIERHLLGD